MAQSIVRPELGPTLPELLAPLPRAARRGLAVAALLVLAVIVGFWVRSRADPLTRIVVQRPVAFNLGYQSPFSRLPARAGELVRVGHRDQWFSVSELRLPPFHGDVAGLLPLYSTAVARELARVRPGLQVRSEGRVNVNAIQGYGFSYIVREAGARVYGQRILLPTDASSRSGVTLALESAASPAVPNPDMVGRTGPLKVTLRSFRFGTVTP